MPLSPSEIKEKYPILKSKTEGKPVFGEDGVFTGEVEGPSGDKVKLDELVEPEKPVETPARVVEDEGDIINEDCSTVEKLEGPDHKPEIRNPGEPSKSLESEIETPTEKPVKRTCQYCDTRVYNSQTLCDKCKEKKFQEIWTEILDPLLENETFFIKKDVADIDFPMNLNNSLGWYIKNGYFSMRKNGKINEYYKPTPEEREKEVPGITKKCRTCGEIKPIDKFYKQKKSTDGYGYACIECDKKRNQNRPRKKPSQLQYIQQLLINDMDKQNKKGQSIRIHLHLLTELENYEEEC